MCTSILQRSCYNRKQSIPENHKILCFSLPHTNCINNNGYFLFLECAAYRHLAFTLAYSLSLIGMTLALTVGKLDFDESVFQIELERNESSSLEFKRLSELQYLPAVHQKAAVAVDNVVELAAELAH